MLWNISGKDMDNNSFVNYDKIEEIINLSESQEIFFFKRKKIKNQTSKYDAYNFEFDRTKISAELKQLVNNTIGWNKGFKHVPYTIALDKTTNDIVSEITPKDVSNFSKIDDAIKDKKGVIFADNTKEIDPNFYTIRFDYNENTVIAFTHYSPAAVFKGKWLFKQAEIYESCISIKKSIDCLYYKVNTSNSSENPEFLEKIIIFKNKKDKFEKIFDYKDDYIIKAKLALDYIKSKNILSNVDAFKICCSSDEYMTKKLAKIHQDKKIDIICNSFNAVIEANNALMESKVQIDENNKMLIIPEEPQKEYLKSILCLLNTETYRNIITKEVHLFADAPVTQQKIPLVIPHTN